MGSEMNDNDQADRRRPTIPDWAGGQGRDWAPASLCLPHRHGQTRRYALWALCFSGAGTLPAAVALPTR